MSILTFVEHRDGAPVQASLGVLTQAKTISSALGVESVAVVAGNDVGELAASLGGWGADRVYVVDGVDWSAPIATKLVSVLDAAVEKSGATHLFASASVLAAEIAGGVAARRGAGINVDGVGIRVDGGDVVFTRPALEDSTWVDAGWKSETGFKGVALFRAGSFPAEASSGAVAQVEAIDPGAPTVPAPTHLGFETVESQGVDITEADVLVGAGRGLGGPEHFEMVENLAKSLGGEVATTRAVVDAGWYDYSTQVGQTGKTVTPKLYIAVGISGAIQHKVGMQNSGTIIAINKDPNAPIFEYSDFGVVGDLFDVVPKLEAAIRESRVS